jgi:peptide-methionine (S)-S-oxide reductase
VQVTFDPDTITFKEILEVFFSIHNPTTLNRQGADVGTQYRSEIFYHNEDQKTIAEEVIAAIEAAKIWPNPIVTAISALDAFYPAEDYHQEYFQRNPYQGYCQVVVAPKVAKFRQKYAHRLKG